MRGRSVPSISFDVILVRRSKNLGAQLLHEGMRGATMICTFLAL